MNGPDEAELAAVVRMLEESGADLVNVGHGRDAASVASARGFLAEWERRGGTTGVVVGWPAHAASWLRPARRLAAGQPDAWVVADTVEGWSGVSARLVGNTDWDPGRTVAFAALGRPALVESAAFETTEGMRGATRAGRMWTVRDGLFREW